jgi:acetyl-CoA carboxylase/biotin carboxylase 1
MSAIGDGSRFDFVTSNASPIGKPVSVVAGAEGLSEALPAMAEIGSMGHSRGHAEVALKARKLLMQESMPSLEQRKARVLQAATNLTASEGTSAEQIPHLPLLDVFFPLLMQTLKSKEELGVLELYARRLYRTYTLKGIEKKYDDRVVKFLFLNKPAERVLHKLSSVSSMTELSRIVSSTISLSKMGEESESYDDSKLLTSDNKEKIPSQIERTGVCKIVAALDDLKDASQFEAILKNFPHFVESTPQSEVGPVNVLYLIVADTVVRSDEASHDAVSERGRSLLEPHKALLERAHVRRVTFSFNLKSEDEFDEHNSPATFTYRSPNFDEESLIRSIDPSHAMHLDLDRVATNFRVRSLGARHTSGCHIHLYEGAPRASALAKDKKANKAPRIFVRALSFSLEFSSSTFERILVHALNLLDLSSNNAKSDNHLFVNLVSAFEKAVLDPVVVEQVVVDILKRHGDRVIALGIVEVETRIVCSLSTDSPPIAIRLVASNPTGYVHVMNTYVEAADESGGDRVFKLIGGTKASLASSGDSSWEGLNVNTPYPLTRPFDAQRKAALGSSDTIYCYDLPALFEASVEQQWLEASDKGGVEGSFRAAGRPLMVMYITELVVQRKGGSQDPWTIQDYLNGDLELTQVNRGAGANDVGMVAWLMVLKTMEYPNVSIYCGHRGAEATVLISKVLLSCSRRGDKLF